MKFIKLWLPLLAWCSLIFYLSSLQQVSTGVSLWDIIFSNGAHFVLYFILTLLAFRAIGRSFKIPIFSLAILAFTFSFFYALSDELHQSYVPTRCPSLEDILVDCLGAIAFLMFYLIYSKKIRIS